MQTLTAEVRVLLVEESYFCVGLNVGRCGRAAIGRKFRWMGVLDSLDLWTVAVAAKEPVQLRQVATSGRSVGGARRGLRSEFRTLGLWSVGKHR